MIKWKQSLNRDAASPLWTATKPNGLRFIVQKQDAEFSMGWEVVQLRNFGFGEAVKVVTFEDAQKWIAKQ